MIGVVIALVLVVALVAGVLLWRSSGRRFPSDESLRHPQPDAAEPLIRPESRHNDTPGAADLDRPSGREHGG
jgi:hypothetical protein